MPSKPPTARAQNTRRSAFELFAPKALLLFWLPVGLLIFAFIFWRQSQQLVSTITVKPSAQAAPFFSKNNQSWYYQADGSLRYLLLSSEQTHNHDASVLLQDINLTSIDGNGQADLLVRADSSLNHGQRLVISGDVNASYLGSDTPVNMHSQSLTLDLIEAAAELQ